MTRQIVIDPVTRIEGHAKITLHLDREGKVADARFHVAEFRGFEKFCEGRPFAEMPGLTARICGICPVSHALASAKAGDGLLAAPVPQRAVRLRRLINLGQIIQSHALSFFYFSSPDLLLGWDSPPESRNFFGLIAAKPALARGGIRLRQFGQDIIAALGGRKIHPAWAIPGGVRSGLMNEHRHQIIARVPECTEIVTEAMGLLKTIHDRSEDEIAHFGCFPTAFLSLVNDDGDWEHYDGPLRAIDADGNILAQSIEPLKYLDWIAEQIEPDSYLKSPHLRRLGPEAGIYRVGPLARLNVCRRIGFAKADAELREFRQRGSPTVQSAFFYHYARLIEILAALETIDSLLSEPDNDSERLCADAGINNLESVGISEAPRGTLFHHYRIDDHGKLNYVNLIIATGQNALSMNRTILQIAQRFVNGSSLSDQFLNRVEAGIRAHDPCLSCSTHDAGGIGLVVRLFDVDGSLLDEAVRQ